ncbi:hypothetical protein JV59_40750 (plasmid) [Vibrio coralliilyticus]|uniref:Uncharacterized protein n=1 Tax=Vibrio coralliilyticus TaxID=190893 RepID=A0AAN0W0C8_9VIBR|nr:hypothetical protein JV59_40750 [Vibrio coralliilyticus]AIW22743.1 hypothetical protein IX92_27185 [Vibrio coralliilyticus]
MTSPGSSRSRSYGENWINPAAGESARLVLIAPKTQPPPHVLTTGLIQKSPEYGKSRRYRH